LFYVFALYFFAEHACTLFSVFHLIMGVREGKNYWGGSKFTRLFPIAPDLLEKIFRVNFPKLLSTEGGGGEVIGKKNPNNSETAEQLMDIL
jgi:hypothetical protein